MIVICYWENFTSLVLRASSENLFDLTFSGQPGQVSAQSTGSTVQIILTGQTNAGGEQHITVPPDIFDMLCAQQNIKATKSMQIESVVSGSGTAVNGNVGACHTSMGTHVTGSPHALPQQNVPGVGAGVIMTPRVTQSVQQSTVMTPYVTQSVQRSTVMTPYVTQSVQRSTIMTQSVQRSPMSAQQTSVIQSQVPSQSPVTSPTHRYVNIQAKNMAGASAIFNQASTPPKQVITPVVATGSNNLGQKIVLVQNNYQGKSAVQHLLQSQLTGPRPGYTVRQQIVNSNLRHVNPAIQTVGQRPRPSSNVNRGRGMQNARQRTRQPRPKSSGIKPLNYYDIDITLQNQALSSNNSKGAINNASSQSQNQPSNVMVVFPDKTQQQTPHVTAEQKQDASNTNLMSYSYANLNKTTSNQVFGKYETCVLPSTRMKSPPGGRKPVSATTTVSSHQPSPVKAADHGYASCVNLNPNVLASVAAKLQQKSAPTSVITLPTNSQTQVSNPVLSTQIPGATVLCDYSNPTIDASHLQGFQQADAPLTAQESSQGSVVSVDSTSAVASSSLTVGSSQSSVESSQATVESCDSDSMSSLSADEVCVLNGLQLQKDVVYSVPVNNQNYYFKFDGKKLIRTSSPGKFCLDRSYF